METLVATPDPESAPVVEERSITIHDRCDRCGHAAYVYVNGISGPLYFCKHHFERWEDKIRSYAFEVVDKRDDIPA
jgi:ribosomal protein L37E